MHFVITNNIFSAIASNGRDMTVDFQQQPSWTGQVTEMELVTDRCEYTSHSMMLFACVWW